MDACELFCRYWEKLRPAVVAYLYARTGDHATVDDLSQEVALAAWRGFDALNPTVGAEAWAMGIARHKLADYFKKRGSIAGSHVEALPATAIDEAALRVADKINARASALRGCIKSLGPSQRELVARRYAHDEAIAAIATATGRTENSIKVRLHRIRAVLRRCIDAALARGGSGHEST